MKSSNKLKLILILLPFSSNTFAVEFSLFGDVTYSVTSETETVQTFTLGQVDLIADQEIGDNTFVTTEIVFEDPGDGFEVDVERFHITRNITPMFNIGMGRYHTPLGIWNHNFHHGSLIQDTISRPFFIEFEDAHGGILPNHLIGLRLHGDTDFFSYQLGIGNSNGITTDSTSTTVPTLEVINSSDPSDDKSLVGRFAFKPNTFISEFGIFYMINSVTELSDQGTANGALLNTGEVLFDQQILGVDLRYTGDKLYLMSEYYLMTIDDNQDLTTKNTEPYDATAYYVQIGYHITENLTTVLRYESLDFDDGSTYFDLLDVHPEERSVIAINYKLQSSNAIRFEAGNSKPHESESYDYYALQWYFLLF